MAKAKLTKIPRATKAKPELPKRTGEAAAPDNAEPDLSRIIEQLRPLAVPVGDLIFDRANPRTHDEENIEAIQGSLAVYGQRKPIVVNRRTMEIEAGNGTLRAALAMNWTHVAAVFVDDDPATANGFKIADNRTAELADWDKDFVRKAIADVSTANDERLDKMLVELAEDLKLIPKDDSGTGQPAAAAPTFEVIVHCTSAEHQQELLERLRREGYDAKIAGAD